MPQETVGFKQIDSRVEKVTYRDAKSDFFFHSKYSTWLDVDGNEGLLRFNSKPSGKKGSRVESEEALQPEAFDEDLKKLELAATQLEQFRLQILDWIYPEE